MRTVGYAPCGNMVRYRSVPRADKKQYDWIQFFYYSAISFIIYVLEFTCFTISDNKLVFVF